MGEALKQHDFVAGALEYRKLNEAWLVEGENKQETGLLEYKHPPYLFYASGCNLGMKRSVYEAIGELNESVLYVWNVDYCLRVQLAGTELHFAPNAVIHYCLRHNFIDIYHQGCNWGECHILLRKKYGEPLSRLMILKRIVKTGLHLSMVFLRSPK